MFLMIKDFKMKTEKQFRYRGISYSKENQNDEKKSFSKIYRGLEYKN